MTFVPQFGTPTGEYIDRPGAYVVAFRDDGKMLTLNVRGKLHLPGGGIDAKEDSRVAVMRETLEETGYELADVREIGRANQFLPNASLGPMNKLGVFYHAKVVTQRAAPSEDDHVPTWVTPEEFLSSNANDFQKWAVRNR